MLVRAVVGDAEALDFFRGEVRESRGVAGDGDFSGFKRRLERVDRVSGIRTRAAQANDRVLEAPAGHVLRQVCSSANRTTFHDDRVAGAQAKSLGFVLREVHLLGVDCEVESPSGLNVGGA